MNILASASTFIIIEHGERFYLRKAHILPEEDGYGGGVVVCFELECCEVADVLLLLVSDFKLSLSGFGALNV